MFRNINKQKLALTGFLLATSGLSLSSLPAINMVGISSLASETADVDQTRDLGTDRGGSAVVADDNAPIFTAACDPHDLLDKGATDKICAATKKSILSGGKCVTIQPYAHVKMGKVSHRADDGSMVEEDRLTIELETKDSKGNYQVKSRKFFAKTQWTQVNDLARDMYNDLYKDSTSSLCAVLSMSDSDAKTYFDANLKDGFEKQIQSSDPAVQQKALNDLKKLEKANSPYVKDMVHLMESYVDADHQIDDAQKYIDSLTDPSQKAMAQQYLDQVKASVSKEFADKGLKFPEPNQTLEDQIKALAAAYQAQLDSDLNDLAKSHGLSTDPRNSGFRGVPYGGAMQAGGSPVNLMQGTIYNGTNVQSANTGTTSFTPATNGGGRGNWSGGGMPSAGSPVK